MDNKRLLILTLFMIIISGVCYLYYSFNPTEHSFFLPCPLRYATGLECPGCGSQRAIHQLLHGNFKAAWSLNPFLIFSIPLMLYGLGIKAYNYLYKASKRFMLFYNKLFIYGYFGIALLFAILRNINVYPFTLLSSGS